MNRKNIILLILICIISFPLIKSFGFVKKTTSQPIKKGIKKIGKPILKCANKCKCECFCSCESQSSDFNADFKKLRIHLSLCKQDVLTLRKYIIKIRKNYEKQLKLKQNCFK